MASCANPGYGAFGQLGAVATLGRVCGSLGRQGIPRLSRVAVGGRGLNDLGRACLVVLVGAGEHPRTMNADELACVGCDCGRERANR